MQCPGALLLLLLLIATATPAAEPLVVDWSELVPADEAAAPAPEDDLLSLDWGTGEAARSFSVVERFDGKLVRMPGFLVPLQSDEGGLLSEFFLVPYYGACIHTPPPPPNQIVYVKLDEPFDLREMWNPYWIEGEMSSESKASIMGEAGYTIRASKIEVYEW